MDTNVARAILIRVVEALPSVRRRPQMYFSPVTPEAVKCWLRGLQVGIGIAGLNSSCDAYQAACARRGIELLATTNLIDELDRQGKASDENAMELIEIEEEMWRGRLAELTLDAADSQAVP
jgi:hypothetical protein